MAATTDPKRWSAVVLVDGGVALPLPDGVDPDAMVAGVLGPALARLDMTFANRAASAEASPPPSSSARRRSRAALSAKLPAPAANVIVPSCSASLSIP